MIKKIVRGILQASGTCDPQRKKSTTVDTPAEFTSNLTEFLSYYRKLEKPNYAVLVTGDWGTGKTHQVTTSIPKEDRLYVSLFGVQSIEQLHSEVFAAKHPLLESTRKHLDDGSKVIASVGGIWAIAGGVPSIFNAAFRRSLEPDHVLIFDDLERSNLELKDVLGAINYYVEHIGFKTIVIAHDSEIIDEFAQLKEKTFGQTIHVAPQTEEAFVHFLSEIKNESALAFVTDHREEILEVFHQSNAKSLRILRHVTEDVARLFNIIASEHRSHAEAMNELLRTFVAFDIEVRSGNLSERDLKNRNGVWAGHAMRTRKNRDVEIETPPLVTANEKYLSIDLENGIFDDDLLNKIFIEGSYPAGNLFNAIANSSYFVDPKVMAPWKVVIHFDDLEDSVVNEAYARMEKELSDFEVLESGEFLHVCALRMVMAVKGNPTRAVSDVVAESKLYVDKLLQMGKLPPRETEWRWYERFNGSYDGFVYWIPEDCSPQFAEIYDHLVACRIKAFNEKAPRIASDLVELMKTDTGAFFEATSPTHTGKNPYAHIPIFFAVSAEEFVNAWLSLPKPQWRTVSTMLENRYSGGNLFNDLSSEKDWALGVLNQLDLAAGAASGFSAFRIRRIRPKVLMDLAAVEQN